MPQICFYFQLHQPFRLKELSVFDVGNEVEYFSSDNEVIFKKVAQKSYIPMLTLLAKLIKEVPDFSFALSCSGVFLEQAQRYQPEVISLLKVLAKSERVELLAETYYHSLASLYSPTEFTAQVHMHLELIQDFFDKTPTVFRNTELIYSNAIASQVAKLGFAGMLTEAVDRNLHGRPKTKVYRSAGEEALPLLLKHAEFSDDIAFRFSDKKWPEYPLTVDKYARWLSDYYDEEIINLFMDFETFGEHQWADTGIFSFFEQFVKTFSKKEHNRFVTPSKAITQAVKTGQHNSFIEKQTLFEKITHLFKTALADDINVNLQQRQMLPVYDVPVPISWADVDRDLTAWVDNVLQQDTLKILYSLRIDDKRELLDTWRKLQTSDHFYYMCTKWAADGDVHAYFSPYESPYEAYRNYCLALSDLSSKKLVML